MKISCSQIDLPNLGLKCLKMGPKPRQLEVGGSKSLDFTNKKNYIYCRPFFMVVSLSTFDGTSAKSWLFSSTFGVNCVNLARPCQKNRIKGERVSSNIFSYQLPTIIIP